MYNKRLSIIESQIGDDAPILLDVDSDRLLYYIKECIFSDPTKYGLTNDQDWNWFLGMVDESVDSASKLISDVLYKSEHAITKKSIVESIQQLNSML